MTNSFISLGDAISFRGGGTPRKDVPEYWSDEIPWATVKDFKSLELSTTQDRISRKGLESSAANLIPAGHVVIPTRMALGKAAINTIDLAINQDLRALVPKVPIDSKYLLHSMLGLAETIQRYGSGATVKGITQKKLANLQIPLPPLPEQKRIAAILDAADALRAKRRESLEQLDTLLQSTFLEMFGDPVTNPMGWDVRDLFDVCEKITDGTHHSPPICEKGIPYVTAKHLKKDGLKFFDNPWFVSPEKHAEIFARCNPELGDVLYIKDGATTGIAAINRYDFEFSMLSSLALLKPSNETLTSEYLTWYLNDERNKSHLIDNMGGAAIKRLTLAKIKKFRVPIPPIGLQQRFATIVEAIEQQKARYHSHLAELDTLFASLQSRAFNGEL